MIKMIVTDLDGTLLNKNGKITKETKTYLCQLKEKGYIIVIATGRTCASALKATDGAEFANFIIFNQGSGIYNVLSKKNLFENYIDKEIISKILAHYNEDVHYIDIAKANISYKYGYGLENNPNNKEDILTHCTNISRITIFMKNKEGVEKIYKQFNSFFQLNIILMQDSFADKQWLDIIPQNCSKFNSILKLLNSLEITTNEIMAFGDGPNDREMLEKCGYGVAIQNALPEVKKSADFITIYDYDHDGVIQFLNKIIK